MSGGRDSVIGDHDSLTILNPYKFGPGGLEDVVLDYEWRKTLI